MVRRIHERGAIARLAVPAIPSRTTGISGAMRTLRPTAGGGARGESHARSQAVGRTPSSDAISIRLLASERDIEETLPLARAAHEETGHRDHPLDPERLRRFVAERFLADPARYGFLIARHTGRPVGMLSCFAERLYYTDVTTVSCLALYVREECRRTLLGGRVMMRLLHAGRRWAINRRAVELRLHVTSGVRIGSTDRVLRRLGFRQTGGNYALELPKGARS